MIRVGDILRQGWFRWARVYRVDDEYTITVRKILIDGHVWHSYRPIVLYSGWLVRLIGRIVWKIGEITGVKDL